MRSTYSNFFPSEFDPKNQHFISSGHNRCIMSNQAIMYGIYEHSNDMKLNNNLTNFQNKWNDNKYVKENEPH